MNTKEIKEMLKEIIIEDINANFDNVYAYVPEWGKHDNNIGLRTKKDLIWLGDIYVWPPSENGQNTVISTRFKRGLGKVIDSSGMDVYSYVESVKEYINNKYNNYQIADNKENTILMNELLNISKGI